MSAVELDNLSKTQSAMTVDAPKTNRPPDTPFKQQRLPAWQPVMSPRWVIGCFFVLAAFIPIGIVIILACDSVIEIEKYYDQVGGRCTDWKYDEAKDNFYCPRDIPLKIKETLKAPIYVYYKLENFYQNHRRYAKSRSDTQLSGSATSGDWPDCEPFLHPGQYKTLSESSIVQVKDKGEVDLTKVTYNPCGLIAWSMFNDSFLLYEKPANEQPKLICDGENFDAIGNVLDKDIGGYCKKKDIAWPSDPGIRFKKAEVSTPDTLTSEGWTDVLSTTQYANDTKHGYYIGEAGHKIPDTSDLDLMVWMRLAPLSSFRKLYRVIEKDLEPGTYLIKVHDRYDVSQFGGKKSVILTTSSFIGGESYFLASLYIAVGGICLIFGVGFFAKHMTTPQRLAAL